MSGPPLSYEQLIALGYTPELAAAWAKMQPPELPPVRELTFEIDGTLPADVLETLPEDLRARVTNPSFIEQARAAIHQQRVARGEVKGVTGRRERIQPIRVKFGTAGFNRKERRRQMAALRGIR